VSAVPGDVQATVSWTASSGADSYNVYWSTSASVSKATGMKVAGATSGGAVSGLVNGTAYYFVVTAANAGGESAESSPAATATPLPPISAAPTGVVAAAGDGEVTVTWAASSGADSYNLYWSTSASASKATGTKVTGATSGGAVSGLVNGTPYYFIVTAVNLGGESAESSPVASATPLPPIPAAPPDVVAVAGDGEATVTWTASPGADSYNLYWSTSAGVSKATGIQVNGATSGAAVSGLLNGTPYYFVVTAVNLGGESAESSPVASATPLPPIPAAPTGVTAVPGHGQVTVSWSASSAADSYNLYYSTSASVSKATGTKVTGAKSAGAVTGLASGTAYYFVVTAVNLGGESAESSPAATATPLSPLPAAPTGVTAVMGVGEVTVSWTASPGADSYNLYYSTSAGVSKATGTKVSDAVSGVRVTGLTPATAYWFVVTAVDLVGEGAESSPAATTTPLPALLGTFAYSGAGNVDLAVDASSKRVYVSGGIYQSGLIRIDASNPASMSQVTLPYGGGVAADSQTGRYATSNYSDRRLYVYNANGSLYDVEQLTGCPGTMDSDPATGRFFVSSQCSDRIAVVFDPSTGNVLQNLTPNYAAGYVVAPLVVSPSYATSTPITGFVQAADGRPGRLYVAGNDGSFRVLDSTTYATLQTFPATSFTSVVADASLALFYASTGTTIRVYDATTYGLVTTVTLPSPVQNMKMVPGDDRLYVLAGGQLHVFQTRGSGLGPAAPTGVTASASSGRATVSWTPSSGARSYNLYYSTSPTVSRTTGTKVLGAVSGRAVVGLTPGTGYYFVVTAVDATGESAESSPAAAATMLPAILGTFGYGGAGGADLAVDASSKRVYVSGSIAQSGLIRIDASNPASMSQVSLPYGGGIAADSATGRYATTNGYGGTLFVYNANDSLYDVEGLSGCPGTMDSDPSTGRIFVSSQCSDRLAVYMQGSMGVVANLTSNGTGSSVVFDPSTGNVLQNLTPNFLVGQVAPLVVSPAYSTSIPFNGFVRAADGALARLYVAGNDGGFRVLDSRTYATLRTFPTTSFSSVAADTAGGVFYASTGATIRVYDASTYALLTTLTLSGTVQNMKMVPGDDRLYAVDGSRLYVIRTR
jgi:fibronectin type 3 domain-containing protein